MIYAVTNGLVDEIPVDAVSEWEQGFLEFFAEQRSELRQGIQESGKLDDDTVEQLRAAVEEYNRRFDAEHAGAETPAGATA